MCSEERERARCSLAGFLSPCKFASEHGFVDARLEEGEGSRVERELWPHFSTRWLGSADLDQMNRSVVVSGWQLFSVQDGHRCHSSCRIFGTENRGELDGERTTMRSNRSRGLLRRTTTSLSSSCRPLDASAFSDTDFRMTWQGELLLSILLVLTTSHFLFNGRPYEVIRCNDQLD